MTLCLIKEITELKKASGSDIVRYKQIAPKKERGRSLLTRLACLSLKLKKSSNTSAHLERGQDKDERVEVRSVSHFEASIGH